jgi:hypothetical protein
MKYVKLLFTSFLISLLLFACNFEDPEISLKTESLTTLYVFADGLYRQQLKDQDNENFGALRCDLCNVLHTRAGEAVYPFAVCYKNNGEKKYLQAGINLGNWLIKQQLENGEWKETPEEWTGTTTDQLLMLAAAYPILEDHLTEAEREIWISTIENAATYLVNVMSPEFASINYCATTTASLVFANMITPNDKFLQKAKILAHQVIARMDEDGFICAEGGRVKGLKYGADVGYEIDMSLWGLALYARLTGDNLVDALVQKSLSNHLYFVYPNGAIDGSWGIRSNKWTVYGSATADGCQILFSLFTSKDPRYRTAALKNLELLRQMHKDGIVGYGPQYFDLFDKPPCIYPTFVRAKNLAMTVEHGDQTEGLTPPLPTDEPSWVRSYPTVDVALVRSDNIMATVSAYRYKDIKGMENSKYMHRPSGGSMSGLWIKDYGFLQIASQTEYRRWEPMHFPEAEGILPLTSRIEFNNDSGYYTNLYEFDGRFTVESSKGSVAKISTVGYLKNKKQQPGGVAFRWTHEVFGDRIIRSVDIRYHGKYPKISIVEPLVEYAGMEILLVENRVVEVKSGDKKFTIKILEGDAKFILGRDEDRYWSPYPSFKCYPVELVILPDSTSFSRNITYEIAVLD